MLTVPELTPQVLYIEPILDVHHLCQAVYQDRKVLSKKSSEQWIDDILIYFYSSNLKVKRKNVKLIHNIHKLQPIVIDEKFHFVLFPLNSSRFKNPFWVNLRQLLEFRQSGQHLVIKFVSGMEVTVDYDYKRAMKQYDNTLHILDRTVKHNDIMRQYFTDKITE